jgi:hypothetical protein
MRRRFGAAAMMAVPGRHWRAHRSFAAPARD